MKHAVHKLLCLILAGVLLGLTACGSKQPTEAQNSRMKAYAQTFIDDLNAEVITERGNKSYLASIGILVSEEEHVADMSAFYGFVEQCESNDDDAVLTIAFFTKTTAFARLIYHNGMVYYMRAEYSEKDNNLEVTSRLFDNMNIVTDEALGKVQLELTYDKKSNVTFTFRPGSAK